MHSYCTRSYNIENAALKSLVWGSLTLASIIHEQKYASVYYQQSMTEIDSLSIVLKVRKDVLKCNEWTGIEIPKSAHRKRRNEFPTHCHHTVKP